jgi:hypothetical protein
MFMRQLLRSLVALALAVSVPAAAWATCAESRPIAQTKQVCPMAAKGQRCCCPAQAGGELPDCCKVKTPTPQAVVLVAPPPAPDHHAVTVTDAGDLANTCAAMAARDALSRAHRMPLKYPHDPTYLRISVLLI